jgi:hypothetical protein
VLALAAVALSSGASEALAFCSQPSEPYCLNTPSSARDDFFAARCRADIESYVDASRRYVDFVLRAARAEERDQQMKVDAVLQRLACQSRGERFCR